LFNLYKFTKIALNINRIVKQKQCNTNLQHKYKALSGCSELRTGDILLVEWMLFFTMSNFGAVGKSVSIEKLYFLGQEVDSKISNKLFVSKA
jgi:hypothetical protein